ncbi:hypothetical protein ACHQM5_014397 [Ranunculus cassubicifolius]
MFHSSYTSPFIRNSFSAMESGRYGDKDGGDNKQDDVATSRYYECVFCKQGFTTAQALGGHMNIHRRERARNKQPTVPVVVSSESMEDYLRPAVTVRPVSAHHLPYYSQAQETPPSSYQMYLPPSTSSNIRHPHPRYVTDHPPRSLPLFEEQSPYANLTLQIGSKEEEKMSYGEDDEVDLELRLGHDP